MKYTTKYKVYSTGYDLQQPLSLGVHCIFVFEIATEKPIGREKCKKVFKNMFLTYFSKMFFKHIFKIFSKIFKNSSQTYFEKYFSKIVGNVGGWDFHPRPLMFFHLNFACLEGVGGPNLGVGCRPGHFTPGQARPRHATPHHARLGQARPRHATPRHARASQAKLSQARPGPDSQPAS